MLLDLLLSTARGGHWSQYESSLPRSRRGSHSNRTDLGRLDDLGPLVQVSFQKSGELRGCAADEFRAFFVHLFAHFRSFECARDFTAEPRDHVFGHTGGANNSVPANDLESRYGWFGYRRHLGKQRRAFGGSNSQRPQPACHHMRTPRGNRGKREIHVTAYQVDHCRARALIWDVNESCL